MFFKGSLTIASKSMKYNKKVYKAYTLENQEMLKEITEDLNISPLIDGE